MRKSPVYSTLACVVAALVAVGALAAAASSSVRHGTADTVELVYWDDIYTDDASKKANMEMIAAFEKKNPNIKVKWVAKPFNQFVPTAKLALQGAGAPDIVICAAADTCNADLVKAGLIIPTDKYAKQYNWFKGIPKTLLGTTMHEKDGTTYRGNTYGMSITYDLVGLYYNKAMLKELGLKKPTTQAEFENALAKAKAAGKTPLMFGDSGKVDLDLHLHAAARLRDEPAGNPRLAVPQEGQHDRHPRRGARREDAASAGTTPVTSPRISSASTSTRRSPSSTRATACSSRRAPGGPGSSTSSATTPATCSTRRRRPAASPWRCTRCRTR